MACKVLLCGPLFLPNHSIEVSFFSFSSPFRVVPFRIDFSFPGQLAWDGSHVPFFSYKTEVLSPPSLPPSSFFHQFLFAPPSVFFSTHGVSFLSAVGTRFLSPFPRTPPPPFYPGGLPPRVAETRVCPFFLQAGGKNLPPLSFSFFLSDRPSPSRGEGIPGLFYVAARSFLPPFLPPFPFSMKSSPLDSFQPRVASAFLSQLGLFHFSVALWFFWNGVAVDGDTSPFFSEGPAVQRVFPFSFSLFPPLDSLSLRHRRPRRRSRGSFPTPLSICAADVGDLFFFLFLLLLLGKRCTFLSLPYNAWAGDPSSPFFPFPLLAAAFSSRVL